MYKIRFNLGKGENFMKWKITDPKGKVKYYDPKSVVILAVKVRLRNHPTIAKKIYDGANKTVCAWIDAQELTVFDKATCVLSNSVEVSYNPRKQPHWLLNGENADNQRFDVLFTNNNKCFIRQ
jgi:hypothetical protein